jgi:hypothetical protein
MPKFAMHNDPKVRKAKYDEKKISGPRHNEGRMDQGAKEPRSQGA